MKPLDGNALLGLKDKAKRARRYFERDWLLNLAFIQGEQYVEYSPQSGRLVEIIRPDGAIRTQRNVMFKIARVEQAKLMRVPLMPSGLPLSEDYKDVMDAKMMNAYYKWLMHEWKFQRKLRTAYFWVVATGNCFLKWYWDGNGNQVAVVPPLDMYPDPYARNMQDCRWMIHQQFMDVDSAKSLFANVKGANLANITPNSFNSVSPAENALFITYSDGYSTLPGTVLNEYWQPPSLADPEGEHTIFTQDGIVFQEPFPYKHGKMPFTHMGYVEQANTKWYGTTMTHIRTPQMEVNRTESQLVENRNMANGKWYIAPDLELNEDPNAKPRQVLKGKGNPQAQPPMLIQSNPLPPVVWAEPDRLAAAMEDIAGQHEVSNGQVPGRVDSAQGIQLLQETEDSVAKGVISSSEEAVADGFWMAGALYQQHGDPQTMLQVYDAAGTPEVHQFQKDRINLKMRVVCQSNTALPVSTAGKWDRVLNLLQYKVIDPPTVMKLLGLTPEDPSLDPAELDRRVANRENMDMIGITFGMPTETNPTGTPSKVVRAHLFDNHGAHREEHDRFRKSADYNAAVARDPRIAQMFDFHDQEHYNLDVQVAVEQAKKQAAIQAALQPEAPPMPPGSVPGPSAPAPPQGG